MFAMFCRRSCGNALLGAMLVTAATTATSAAAAAAVDGFQDVQWESHRIDVLGMSLRIPYDWEVGPSPFGETLWYAAGDLGSPSLSVTAVPAPDGLTLEQATQGAVARLPGRAEVIGARDIDLNGTPAREVTTNLDLPLGAGIALQARMLTLLRDGRLIVVSAIDGRLDSGFYAPLAEALASIEFDAAEPPVAAPRSDRPRSRPFEFVALGDTAYNGERDYEVYRRLIERINGTRPAFSIHVGDLWGIGNCHDSHLDIVGNFFASYDHPVVLTPGDNEWTDCGHRAMGGYAPAERLTKLREVYFAQPKSLGARSMPLVRQADIAPYPEFVENARWVHEDVLFLTVNVPGSNNNFRYDDLESLKEAHARDSANVAWLRDGFRLAREAGHRAVVIALHAEILMNGRVRLNEYGGPLSGPHGAVVGEIRRGGERYGGPVLLVHGDSHEFVIDRPFIESRGESELPRYGNITRLEVYGAPEIRAVRVSVDTSTPWVFAFSPLYDQ
jgi:hypothetical protein